jgi:purine-binding chemotaxis protein CheW
MEKEQLLVFKLDKEELGLNIKNVDEIIPYKETVKIPNTPDFIDGLINLRGKVYPVFNLRNRFHFPPYEFDESTKIIIVNINSVMIGLIADEVKEILLLEEETVENTREAGAHLSKRFINSIVRLDDRTISILNPSEVASFTEEELKKEA